MKSGKINNLEEIFLHSIPIKEHQIVDQFIGQDLQDEVVKIASVQKQTKAGQRTRFKAVIAVGDKNGHVGVGVKCAKEVQIAIQEGLKIAKKNIIPVRKGYWGNKIGQPHTVPCKTTGKAGSVVVRLIPAPRGTGIVGAPTSKKLLTFAGVNDCFTKSEGKRKTTENFLKATFAALRNIYGFLTPDLWGTTQVFQHPFEKHSRFLQDYKAEAEKKRGGRRGARGRGGRGRGGRGGRGRGAPRGN